MNNTNTISKIKNSGQEKVHSRVFFTAESRIMVDLIGQKLEMSHHDVISGMFSKRPHERNKILKAIEAVKQYV
jgi:hypothetical protein